MLFPDQATIAQNIHTESFHRQNMHKLCCEHSTGGTYSAQHAQPDAAALTKGLCTFWSPTFSPKVKS